MILKPWRWGLGIALTGVALFVACDGTNLYDPGQNPFATPQVSVAAPSNAFAGDSVTVSVSASAASNLASIAVAVRGAVNKDTTITASGRTATATLKFGLPSILTDTLVYISAIATDQVGNVSKLKADTMTVVGPPSILSVSQPDSLKAGQTSSFRVRAFGTRRIAQIDMQLRGAIVKDTTIFVTPPVNSVTQDVSITVPALPADTAVRVTIVAKDVSGLSSVPTSVALPLAVSAPVAVLSQANVPATVAPGTNLDVTVRGTSSRTITKLGVVLSGAMSGEFSVDVNPPQSDATRTISVPVPSNVPAGNINVTAFAIDKSGQRSVPTAAFVVSVNNGVPVIVSVTAADSIGAGKVLDVRVIAQGVRPLANIELRARGAVDNVQTKVTSGTNATVDFEVTVPQSVADTLLTLTAVATDANGQKSALGPSATKVVRVADLTAPNVTATPNKTNTSAGGTFSIRIQATDNVGLARVGYAVVNPAGDTIGTTPTLVATRGAAKDTTFSFTVPLTITPRTVRVLGIAVDASGRRGISSAATVIVADSAAPTITVIAPAANATLPLNDSVRVQVRVQDATGIKQITLIGQSTRVDSLGPTRTVQRFTQKILTFPAVAGQPLPRDTTITRYLNAIADSISEPVDIIITATDSLNNVATATATILVGGPRVELRNPINNAQVVPGGTLLLTAFAVDRASGIDSVRIAITGAQTQTYLFKSPCAPATCAPNGLATNDSVVINQNYVVGPTLGTLSIQATAWNRNRIAGTSTPATVTVGSVAATDTAKPQVRLSITANDRVELSDTITVNVAAQDIGQAGLRRVGIVVIANPGGTGVAPDTLYRDSVYVGSGRTGLQPAPFKFTLRDFGYNEINLLRLPRTITFSVYAFAVDADAAANCGANTTSTLAAQGCTAIASPPAPAGRPWFVASNGVPGMSQLVTVVPGFARALPSAGSTIADLLVDNNAARPRMYMSNQNFNRVEILNLTDSTFANAVSVGSEPWGLSLNNAAVGIGGGAPRLMVANSGGTNLSMVDITQPVNSVAEVPAERILTPNVVLFDVVTAVNNGLVRYIVDSHDFSDRPQFVGQDANGIILYSTKPTGAAPDGTVRYLLNTAPRREAKIMFNANAFSSNNDAIALAHLDSIVVRPGGNASDLINLYDHALGNPAVILQSGFTDLNSAITIMQGNGSDMVFHGGVWNLAAVGLSDTTFIATSGDRQFVGFGEGGTGTFARVWLWRAASASISDDIAVTDLVGNASERVLGIALNNTGSIGAARGAVSTSFFSNNASAEGDLRLQGVFSNGVAGGNGGVALHPSHNTALSSTNTTLAFIATVNRSIKIVDTFNFRERGEILIRDNIVGPLRAALPLPAENAGLVGTCNEIWTKLYGVTGAGRAVIINVRAKDIINPVIVGGCP